MNGDHPRRAVLITGCSSGIGYASASLLAERGFQVIASARKPGDVQRLRTEGMTAVQLDLDDSHSIADATGEVLELTGGRLYGLFNNAGFGQPGAVEDLSRDALRAQFETNLFGTLELTNHFIPVMRAAGEGRIIQNSSLLGLVALTHRGAYNASKYALEGLYDTLRLELAGSGVYAVLIEPGPIESRFRSNALAAYRRNIDAEKSLHRECYQATEARLHKAGHAAPFTLPASAVAGKLLKILEARNPKPRYYVTLPTWFLGGMKRILTSRALDRLLLKISEK